MVVVRWAVVVVTVIIVSDSMIANLSENVDVSPRFASYVVR